MCDVALKFGIRLAAVAASFVLPISAAAQVVPDATLPEASRVATGGDTFQISGGTTAGANLFHSFSQFDLPTGTTAQFDNALTIDNIIARVTGNSATIDGTIATLGTANLYLLSPGGLTFGENARLSVGGSFTGSTAAGLLFEGGEVFSATSTAAPVLSVNVPIGLQLGGVDRVDAPIFISGSQLIAPGTLTLGGGEISLDNAAIAQGSGVEIVGTSLDILGGSRVQSISDDSSAGGSIRLELRDRVNIAGFTPDGQYSGIFSQTTGSGAGSDIAVISPNVTLSDRGFIAAQTTGSGAGDTIAIDATTIALTTGGQILTETTGTGSAGAIALRASADVTIDGRSDRFRVSPFADLPSAYDTTGLEFTTSTDPNIEASETIPNLSLARTETTIQSGSSDGAIADTVLATAPDAVFDYYIFATSAPNSRAIVDIDFGAIGLFDDGSPGSMGTEIFILDYETAELIETSAGAFDPDLGGAGSTSNFDAYIDTTLPDAGTYVLAVGEFDSGVSNSTTFEPVIGEPTRLGGTYVAQLSLAAPGTPSLEPSEATAPGIFNPNFGDSSAIFSLSRDAGRGGDISIEAGNIAIANGGELSAVAFAGGDSGNVTLAATDLLRIDDGNALVSTQTRGAGRAGDITLTAAQLDILGAARVDSSTFGTGDSGEIVVTASGALTIDSRGGERTATGIFNEVKELAVANGGNIIIQADTIVVRSAKLSGTMRGIGDSGDLILEAGTSLVLEDGSDLDVEVNSQAIGNGGNIILRAPTIRIANGTEIETEIDGEGVVGTVDIVATERVEIAGGEIQVEIDERGRGVSGSLFITAPVVSLTDEALLEAKLDDDAVGTGGTIAIVADFVEILNSELALDADSGAIGDSGDLRIEATTIVLGNGATISTSTNGTGNAGATELIASESIAIDNSRISGAVEADAIGDGGQIRIVAPRLSLTGGAIVESQTEGDGRGGTIVLEVGDLSVTGGSQISASTLGDRAGGDVTISASGTVFLSGFSEEEEPTASAIAADAPGTGDAGSVSLSAQRLEVRNGGALRVDSDLAGLGGNLTIDAPDIRLSDARLTANAAEGDRANISISSEDLRLTDGTTIATNATGSATGGNIAIDTDTLIAFQNSDITANATDSFGGQIAIDAVGVFGTEFRAALTPESDITATSALGATFSGTVSIATPDIDATAGLVDLPEDPIDPDAEVAQGCATGGSSLTVTGRAGLPEIPDVTLPSDLPSYPVRGLAEQALSEREGEREGDALRVASGDRLREASSWTRSASGAVVLADGRSQADKTPHTCHRSGARVGDRG